MPLPRLSALIVAAALAGLVAACTPEPEFGQCEPGVGELSRTGTVCP
ncbi:MAG: hypothetical protein N2Z62_07860 [Rhodobacteraceae bacterium]|nr:hypothetical protein [Paracoccaceae bacterium]